MKGVWFKRYRHEQDWFWPIDQPRAINLIIGLKIEILSSIRNTVARLIQINLYVFTLLKNYFHFSLTKIEKIKSKTCISE